MFPSFLPKMRPSVVVINASAYIVLTPLAADNWKEGTEAILLRQGRTKASQGKERCNYKDGNEWANRPARGHTFKGSNIVKTTTDIFIFPYLNHSALLMVPNVLGSIFSALSVETILIHYIRTRRKVTNFPYLNHSAWWPILRVPKCSHYIGFVL